MKFKIKRKIFFPVSIILLSSVILLFTVTGCYENPEIAKKLGQTSSAPAVAEDSMSDITDDKSVSSSEADKTVSSQTEASSEISKGTSPFNSGPPVGGPPYSTQEIDGLHVTGNPVEIDIEEYRLKITGMVENELSLSFEEIKAMPSVKIFAVLDCPGFFVDEGYWTGVEIKYLLDKAGVKKEEASTLLFADYENSYVKKIDIEKAYQEGFLVAYQFNDKEFLPVHGFPLRIVAKGEPGGVWVKWLGEIKVK